ncbi:MAG: hypothetical protein F4X17_14975 [Gemmatimonadetes bacterium]|nr:hypothetical protein [Gemmatimonadota bacterium]
MTKLIALALAVFSIAAAAAILPVAGQSDPYIDTTRSRCYAALAEEASFRESTTEGKSLQDLEFEAMRHVCDFLAAATTLFIGETDISDPKILVSNLKQCVDALTLMYTENAGSYCLNVHRVSYDTVALLERAWLESAQKDARKIERLTNSVKQVADELMYYKGKLRSSGILLDYHVADKGKADE